MTGIPKPELSKIVKLSELGSAPVKGEIEASRKQCDALAKRFDLPSIETVHVDYLLRNEGTRIHFSGSIASNLHQNCVISGQKFPARVDEQFTIIFVENIDTPGSGEEIELASDDCDLVEYQNDQIDIGEAVAQTLFLALDPYPRGPEADAIASAKGLKSEEEAGPFGALAALKDKLG